MGRPVFTHELANKKVQDEIKEKSKDDFLKLCDEPESCVATVKFNKEDMQKIVDEKVKEMTEEMPEHAQIEAMVNYYGANDRLRLLMEECGELVQAANKILRYPGSDKVRANLLEEMVDVSIMIQQIHTLLNYSDSEWNHMMQYKVNRCKKRFEEDTYYTRNKYNTKKENDK
jgi:NTP pyrophosphatase (non-canonical NTP hydrolase)